MGYFPKPAGPRAAWRDLRTFLAARPPHYYVILALSIAMPILIVLGFAHDSRVDPPGPQMWYLPSWPADRSDAQIVAQQKIDQAAMHKAQAEKRAAYQRLAKEFGIN